MRIYSVPYVPHLRWSRTPDHSDRQCDIPYEVPIQTVSLQNAAFQYAGLGLSRQTTRMLGEVATHLKDNPSSRLAMRNYQSDTDEAYPDSLRVRTHLVEAYLDTQGIDVAHFIIKSPNPTRLPMTTMDRGLMVEVMRNYQPSR